MDPSEEVCRSLVKWLQTLVPQRTRSALEISDGVAILDALIQISRENFIKLQTKIKADVGNNWRLKVSNLKKINEAIVEYYQDILNLQILDGRPDVVKLGETGDLIQLGKLLRLLLGCAVNCERKQDYITKIMNLEESVQRCIMLAIQQLEELTGGPGRSGLSLISLDNESRILKLSSELDSANEAKDILAQHCHELESKVQSLQLEKQALLTDNQVLASQIKEKEENDNPRGLDNRLQLELLKDEIFKLETIRDDYRAKVMDQEKQISSLQEKIADLQLAAEATSRLKDEVDALTESADKVKTLEMAVASYKKRLEDYALVKKQLKVLEDKNVEYLQQNLKYEEELKKNISWKTQTERYKTQAADLQQKLDEGMVEIGKLQFHNKNLESNLEAQKAEKERTARERDALREENEELRLGTNKGEDGAAMAEELAPTELKERLRYLEKENLRLRTTNQEAESKQVLLEDNLSRMEKLTDQNRAANQRILELEQDLQTSHAKYARSIEKVREVAIALDSKNNGSMESSIRHNNNMKEDEDRLITTAFYQLGHQCHREAVDERLALLSAGQGQSFLSRQRQPMPRKSVTPFKSK